jgi:hypothetical protein
MTDENGTPFGRLLKEPEPGEFLRFENLSYLLKEKNNLHNHNIRLYSYGSSFNLYMLDCD